MDKSGPNRFVFPTGLNILDKDTKIIVNKISRTRELSETAKTSIDIRNVTPRKRVVFQCPTATLVPNTKGKREHERQKEAKEVFGMGQSRAFQMERGKIVTHVKNYEATTRQQIRDDKIREIMKSDRKRRKEEKKLRAEKSKVFTCIYLNKKCTCNNNNNNNSHALNRRRSLSRAYKTKPFGKATFGVTWKSLARLFAFRLSSGRRGLSWFDFQTRPCAKKFTASAVKTLRSSFRAFRRQKLNSSRKDQNYCTIYK